MIITYTSANTRESNLFYYDIMAIRIYLIVPPAPFLSIPNASPHLGVLYLASFLQANYKNIEINILDLFNGYDSGAFEIDYDYYCFTASTPQYLYAKEIMEDLRTKGATGIFVIGGPHATHCYQEAIDDGFNIVVIGEGELALLDIISKKLCEGVIRGTSISDISSIPHPAYDKIDLASYNYSFNSKKIAQIITARGCVYGCNFCLIPSMHDRFRMRTTEDVRREIDILVQKYGITGLYIVDAVFPSEIERTIKICQILREYGLDWVCQTRPEKVNAKLLDIMAEAGCKRISFGLETATDSNLHNINKKATLAQYATVLRATRTAGIRTRFYMIWGLPWDNRETANAFKQLTQNPPDEWHLNTFIPFPGTPYWEKPEKYGIEIVDRNYKHYYHLGRNAKGSIVINNTYCSKEELEVLRDELFTYILNLIPDKRVLYGMEV